MNLKQKNGIMGSRRKFTNQYETKDIYKYYIENLDEIERKNGYGITYGKFRKILSKINCAIMTDVVISRSPYLMPSVQFELFVKKRKTKTGTFITKDGRTIRYGPVDWKGTHGLWAKDADAKKNKQLIFHLNEHTDGYMYCFDINRRLRSPRNKLYSFKPMRKHKRLLAKQLIDGADRNAYEFEPYKIENT